MSLIVIVITITISGKSDLSYHITYHDKFFAVICYHCSYQKFIRVIKLIKRFYINSCRKCYVSYSGVEPLYSCTKIFSLKVPLWSFLQHFSDHHWIFLLKNYQKVINLSHLSSGQKICFSLILSARTPLKISW